MSQTFFILILGSFKTAISPGGSWLLGLLILRSFWLNSTYLTYCAKPKFSLPLCPRGLFLSSGEGVDLSILIFIGSALCIGELPYLRVWSSFILCLMFLSETCCKSLLCFGPFLALAPWPLRRNFFLFLGLCWISSDLSYWESLLMSPPSLNSRSCSSITYRSRWSMSNFFCGLNWWPFFSSRHSLRIWRTVSSSSPRSFFSISSVLIPNFAPYSLIFLNATVLS